MQFDYAKQILKIAANLLNEGIIFFMDLYILLNHKLSKHQVEDAKKYFGIDNIIYPPEQIQKIWANINPEGDLDINPLNEVINWLKSSMVKNDYICIQGEFGAAFYIVEFCYTNDFIPLYATSKRIYEEKQSPDGSVIRKHIFKHIGFRKYRSFK